MAFYQILSSFSGEFIDYMVGLILISSSSWLDRIPFKLLFGVATSVELFQARLLKSTCRKLYGDQFDVEQSSSILGKIFKVAIAHADAPLTLGPSFVRGLLDRQHDQVVGVQVFVASLKVITS